MTQTELTPTTSLTGKWKPYPAYKDSGVEWLGEIPEALGSKTIKTSIQSVIWLRHQQCLLTKTCWDQVIYLGLPDKI